MNKNLYPTSLNFHFGTHHLKINAPEGVWNPTPHGVHLANSLLKVNFSGEHVLEIGSGCGIHSILIARQHARELTVTEIAEEILENTKFNLDAHQINIPVHYLKADWTHVPGEPWDTLISNPPFAKSGKKYRRYFIDTLINDAHKLLKPGGRLIFVQSSMADIAQSLNLMEKWGMSVSILLETTGPFRDYYLEDLAFMEEIKNVPESHFLIDDYPHEKLVVFEARLPL